MHRRGIRTRMRVVIVVRRGLGVGDGGMRESILSALVLCHCYSPHLASGQEYTALVSELHVRFLVACFEEISKANLGCDFECNELI